MKVLITAGGTREYIDDVRVLTNISSGKLGAIIADEFVRNQHEVTFIHSSTSVKPVRFISCKMIEASSVNEVMNAMSLEVPDADVVIHAMAVSDYYFERKNPTKVEGNDVDALAEYIRLNARVSPKIISRIKEWNPVTFLVGFKFTVGKTIDELATIAKASCETNGCDLVVANDKEIMKRLETHFAIFVKPDGSFEPFYGKGQIAKGLVKILEKVI